MMSTVDLVCCTDAPMFLLLICDLWYFSPAAIWRAWLNTLHQNLSLFGSVAAWHVTSHLLTGFVLFDCCRSVDECTWTLFVGSMVDMFVTVVYWGAPSGDAANPGSWTEDGQRETESTNPHELNLLSSIGVNFCAKAPGSTERDERAPGSRCYSGIVGHLPWSKRIYCRVGNHKASWPFTEMPAKLESSIFIAHLHYSLLFTTLHGNWIQRMRLSSIIMIAMH